jgi:hypothetical protein
MPADLLFHSPSVAVAHHFSCRAVVVTGTLTLQGLVHYVRGDTAAARAAIATAEGVYAAQLVRALRRLYCAPALCEWQRMCAYGYVCVWLCVRVRV